jgi:hypothetical protein
MNPQQKQMLNMMYASTAKTEEELNKMTPEEKKEYLRSRLHQKMNIGGLQRRTNFQKTQIQEKLQATSGEADAEGEEKPKKSKNAKKREKERMKKLAELLQTNDGTQPVEVKKSESESDYESDKEQD